MKFNQSSITRFTRFFNIMIIAALLVTVVGMVLPVSASSPADEDHSGFYLEDLSREKAALNSSPFTMRLEGSGFVTGAVVLWEGVTELTPSSLTDHIIQVAITADLLTVPGTFHISVKNPDTTISNAKHFIVSTSSATRPVISRLNPKKVYVETGADGMTFQLLVYGRNFLPAAIVKWYDPKTALTTELTKSFDCAPTLCTVTVDKALISHKTEVKITVANGLDVSKSKSLEVKMPTPLLTSMDPAQADPGSPDITLNLVGDRFQVNSVVRWNEHALPGPVTFTDAQHISVVVPAAYLVKSGKKEVDVYTPYAGHSRDLHFIVTGATSKKEH